MDAVAAAVALRARTAFASTKRSSSATAPACSCTCGRRRSSLAGVPCTGDAHPGNVLRSSAGRSGRTSRPACVAPREYDLASVLVRHHRSGARPVAPGVVAGYGEYVPAVVELMLPAYGVFNAAWTVQLVRTYRPLRAVEIRDHRVGWWRARYAGG